MDPLMIVILYFSVNLGLIGCALLYWMAIENMQPVESKHKEHKKLYTVFILSLLFSPLGAWVISLLVKLRSIIPMLKRMND